MSGTIGILGATGVYARHLIPRLKQVGYTIRALVRRPEAARVALACGADVIEADIFDRAAMARALQGCTISINLATALPGPSGRGTYEANDTLRSEGTGNWLAACEVAGVGRVIQQSIGMVNASGGSEWSDESYIQPAGDDSISARAIAASLTMEAAVMGSALDWTILRGGLFYGPGTGFDEAWIGMAAAGKLKLPGNGRDYVSLIHIADMAAATVAALARWQSRKTFIVCDDEPAQWRHVFGYIAQVAGQAELREGGQAGFPSFRLRNAQARDSLGWTPFFKDFRAGLAR